MKSDRDSSLRNDPLAWRMCAIAFLSANVSMACGFSSFGVLLGAVEAKMGVTRDLSSLGVPLASLGLSVMSPMVGALATKLSIRLLMIAGVMMNVIAYAVLALSSSIVIDLVAYGLLIGPGLSLTGAVLPFTLVARWFQVNQGWALGLVTMPLVPALMPLAVAMALRALGLSATYTLMAALMALLLVPLLFVVDAPPQKTRDPREDAAPGGTAVDPGMTIRQLLGRPHFWTLTLSRAAIMMSAGGAAVHLVPMTRDWGLDAMQAASLLTAFSAMGMAGTLVFGWLADRLGYKKALALLCIDSAILWAIMLLHPTYDALLLVAGLIGFHAGASIPVFGVAVTQAFGRASFGRAFGLSYVIDMPFSLLSVPIAARVYMRTGSYSEAMMGLIAFILLATLLVLFSRGAKPLTAAP
jgi:MFS family permease